MTPSLSFCPSVSDGFVTWGTIGQHFIALQASTFIQLEEEIRDGISLIEKNAVWDNPVSIALQRKYIRPTILASPTALPDAFKQVLHSGKDGTVENESSVLIIANWSEGTLLLPKVDFKPELVTASLTILQAWIAEAQKAGFWKGMSKDEAVKTALVRAGRKIRN